MEKKKKMKGKWFSIKRHIKQMPSMDLYLDPDSNNTTVKRHLSQIGKLMRNH